jgi:hypothetical protein
MNHQSSVVPDFEIKKQQDGKAYFDVGIAIADRHIEFTNYVRPICLPMRPGLDFFIDTNFHIETLKTIYV